MKPDPRWWKRTIKAGNVPSRLTAGKFKLQSDEIVKEQIKSAWAEVGSTVHVLPQFLGMKEFHIARKI